MLCGLWLRCLLPKLVDESDHDSGGQEPDDRRNPQLCSELEDETMVEQMERTENTFFGTCQLCGCATHIFDKQHVIVVGNSQYLQKRMAVEMEWAIVDHWCA